MNGGSLHVNPGNAKEGSTVTVTVIPDEGYTLERLTVTDEDGNAIQTTDTGGGKYTFTMPDSRVTLDASFAVREATATGVHFLNVPSGAYYADTVVWAVEQGITAGTSATAFSPDVAVTRGQTITFLHRAAGSPMVDGNVASDAFYASAVQWAVGQGITSGTSTTTFSPDNNCTRAEICAFLISRSDKLNLPWNRAVGR